jgi:hypothetical protein
MIDHTNHDYLDKSMLCARFCIPPARVAAWVADGRLPRPALRLSRKTWLWDRGSVEAWADERRAEAAAMGADA